MGRVGKVGGRDTVSIRTGKHLVDGGLHVSWKRSDLDGGVAGEGKEAGRAVW